MRLIINGEAVSVTHMGPDFLLVKDAGNHPPSEATIILQVDQSERRWQVRLPEGIRLGQQRVLVSKPDGQ